MDTGSGASDKAASLAAAREKERLANESKLASLQATANAAASKVLASKFAGAESAGAAAEAFLRERTIGLLSREEYAAAREESKVKEVELRIAAATAPCPSGGGSAAASGASRSWGGGAGGAGMQQQAGKKRSSKALLSFAGEEEEEEEEEEREREKEGEQEVGASGDAQRRRLEAAAPGLGKDPTVATSFLPDAAREARELALREQARAEWAALQERIKAEPLTVVYSYWDGTGHRRELSIPKGASIGRFLEAARADLAKEFPELRAMSVSGLLYVKEDLIIPQHHTFYELISTEARGKSGPLFAFGVHEDVRLAMDARVEKEDSHPGKILDAKWYARNKHIFPYHRWEVFQPGVARDKYTIA
jgi:protein FAM50